MYSRSLSQINNNYLLNLLWVFYRHYLGYYYITHYLYSTFEWFLLVRALYLIYIIIIKCRLYFWFNNCTEASNLIACLLDLGFLGAMMVTREKGVVPVSPPDTRISQKHPAVNYHWHESLCYIITVCFIHPHSVISVFIWERWWKWFHLINSNHITNAICSYFSSSREKHSLQQLNKPMY